MKNYSIPFSVSSQLNFFSWFLIILFFTSIRNDYLDINSFFLLVLLMHLSLVFICHNGEFVHLLGLESY